jgi:hypothetical protein
MLPLHHPHWWPSAGPDTGFLRRAALHLALYGAVIAGICWIRHEPDFPPPPAVHFAGLPVSGNLRTARNAGLNDCFNIDAVNVRCRMHRMMFLGNGPYEAAVDLAGSKGQLGYDHLTLWSDDDQAALYAILISLYRLGWRSCHSENLVGGDQAIFTHAGAPARISIDISYYGKRRLRIFPNWKSQRLSGPCFPDEGLGIFNINV